MKYFLFIFCIACGFSASAQPESITYEGKSRELFSKPLDQYFEKHPEKRPQFGLKPYSYSNYSANFEIADGKLRLTDITVSKDTTNTMDRSRSIFRDLFGDAPFDCTVYTGLLVMPYGEENFEVVTDEMMDADQYQLLEIQDGKLMRSKILPRKQYKTFLQKQFAAYRKTDAYVKHAAYFRTQREQMLGGRTFENPDAKNKLIEKKENMLREERHINDLVKMFPWYYNWMIIPEF